MSLITNLNYLLIMYQISDSDSFANVLERKFYKYDDVVELVFAINGLNCCTVKDFDRVNNLVNDFLLDKAKFGYEMFQVEVRFPEGEHDIYISSFDEDVRNIFHKLISICSKEIKFVEINSVNKELQGLTETLFSIVADTERTWTQAKFETKIKCVWD